MRAEHNCDGCGVIRAFSIQLSFVIEGLQQFGFRLWPLLWLVKSKYGHCFMREDILF